jgi:hypothetical protein
LFGHGVRCVKALKKPAANAAGGQANSQIGAMLAISRAWKNQ